MKKKVGNNIHIKTRQNGDAVPYAAVVKGRNGSKIDMKYKKNWSL